MAILQLQKSYLYLEQKAFPHLAIGLKEAFNTMLLLMGREAQIQSIKIWNKTQFLLTGLLKMAGFLIQHMIGGLSIHSITKRND